MNFANPRRLLKYVTRQLTLREFLGAVPRWAGRRFRRRRMQRLLALFAIQPEWRVLDVGGTISIWELCTVRPRLVLLNTPRGVEAPMPGVSLVQGDGRSLPFPDRSFDLVFSNSVIEHLGSPDAMQCFASEIRRVGKRYFVQTPDAAFPIEPHLYTPFLHWLPGSWQRRIAGRFSVWSLLAGCTADQREFYIRHFPEDIRLLNAQQMQRLFPDALILRERFLGLSKSLIAAAGILAQDSGEGRHSGLCNPHDPRQIEFLDTTRSAPGPEPGSACAAPAAVRRRSCRAA